MALVESVPIAGLSVYGTTYQCAALSLTSTVIGTTACESGYPAEDNIAPSKYFLTDTVAFAVDTISFGVVKGSLTTNCDNGLP